MSVAPAGVDQVTWDMVDIIIAIQAAKQSPTPTAQQVAAIQAAFATVQRSANPLPVSTGPS